MADYAMSIKNISSVTSGVSGAGNVPYFYVETASNNVSILKYRMRGIDSACVTQPTYVYWVVEGEPDYTGAQVGTMPCGTSVDLINIQVAAVF